MRHKSAVGTKRAFAPDLKSTDPLDRIADALEFIASAVSAIDHNLEVLVAHTTQERDPPRPPKSRPKQ